MTRFMDHTHHGAEEFIFVIARGDTHILRHAATERVRADIQTTGAKVKAQTFHHFQPKLALFFDVKRTLRRDAGFRFLLFDHGLQQIRQPGFQIAKQHVEFLRGHTRFV